MTETILDLATLIERPTIDIDGTRYEMLSPDELSVLDNRRFGLWAQRLDALQQQDGLDPELEALVTMMARKVLVGVPDDVFAKLTGTHLISVVEVFTGLLLRSKMRVVGATQVAVGNLSSQLIGEIFSPGSSGFTVAPPASGWRTRLWRWFRPT